jgi:hypothetical protein
VGGQNISQIISSSESRESGEEFEQFLITEERHLFAPKEAKEKYESGKKEGIATVMAYHPKLGYAVLQMNTGGSYIIYKQKNG